MKIIESRFYAALMVITDYFLLGLLWLLTSLPLITIFHSTSALFSVIKQWQKGNTGDILKYYFSSFKQQFGLKFIVFIFYLLCMSVIYLDFSVLSRELITDKFSIVGLMTALLILIAGFVQMALIDMTTKKYKITEFFKLGALTVVRQFSHSIYYMLLIIGLAFSVLWFPFSMLILVPLVAKLICLKSS